MSRATPSVRALDDDDESGVQPVIDDDDGFSIDRDVAELAGFGAALAEYDFDFDGEFESDEFESGELSIDEILAEGRRQEAAYAATAPPQAAREIVTKEDIQTLEALQFERERKAETAKQIARRERENEAALPKADEPAVAKETQTATKKATAKAEPEPLANIPGAFATGKSSQSADPRHLRALPQPKQDDRVRPPEVTKKAPPPARRRALPLQLRALFALLSVTALVLIAIGFDDPTVPTTATEVGTETTTDTSSEGEAATDTSVTASDETQVDTAEADSSTGDSEADVATESETDAVEPPPPAVSLDDLGPLAVTMTNGVITLDGPLPNQAVVDLFVERAQAAVGEANVIDNLVVHPDAPPPENGNVRVDSAVVFTTGGTEIPTRYAATINQTVALMQLYPDVTLIIEGHSDSDGTPEQNVRFSENRANAIVAWLAASGISPDRMTIIGYGDARPVATNETDEGKAANRRVDLEFVDLLAG